MDFAIYTGANPAYIAVATKIWNMHQNNNQLFNDTHQFICPECGVKLLLVGLYNAAPKRVYFKTFPGADNDHKFGCQAYLAKYLKAYNKVKKEVRHEDGVLTSTDDSLSFKQQPFVDIKSKSDNSTSNDKSDKSKNLKERNKNVSLQEYHSRANSIFTLNALSVFIEDDIEAKIDWHSHPVKSVEWLPYDKNNHIRNGVQGIELKNTTFGDFVIDMQLQEKIPVDQVRVFRGMATVHQTVWNGFNMYEFRFGSNVKVRFGVQRLSGMRNIEKVRKSAKTGEQLLVLLAGHFYQKSVDNPMLVFVPRTQKRSDFIVIPDQVISTHTNYRH
ncbi:hypothetical protein HAU32_07985 [Weissella confusa]|uniref:Competence protein n=1 Tax=Weissella fermenti TaxID=2987699 RepID=A0ABT6D4W7_9LACO|nr:MULTISPECIES: hypothetical protein [Weissella]MBJ7688911.1 hypothetical protein [Weissella confusa]MCW0926304.1 hypothetical protein [Weissella sp. LMG 11983]MDF9298727.1 hypothetical protein [Weissella sp. BK2]